MNSQKTLVFIPTYNERENVERLCMEILQLGLNIDVLFLDDNSPDGTGNIVDLLSEKYRNVHVIHRPAKLGIGSAHLDGISWAYAHEFSILITMDSDFSHSPECILDLLKHSKEYDIVVGSRYLQDRSLVEWNLLRKSLTMTGHLLTKYLLGMDYDATGAFRLYRLDKIPRQAFHLAHSIGYSFFFESLYILHLNGFSVKEIPITLPARTYGHSKMTVREALRSVRRLVQVWLTRAVNPRQYAITEPYQLHETTEIPGRHRWDEYWAGKSKTQLQVYDLVATFYRKQIIGPTLNHYVEKHFPRGSRVLHAGCGSGQVDIGIRDKVSIIALDISVNALTIYKEVNDGSCKMLRGSTLSIPLNAEAVDGVYSLGLMEHFTQEEIHCTLREFHRVLKPNGKVILFWPPEFGLTTNVLDMAHFILNRILRKNVRLHPDEISRIKSKKQVQKICEQAGFHMIGYHFGVRDFFTQIAIVLTKNNL